MMSDCTNGGRNVYAQPAIHGKLIYADGTESEFMYARMVNGEERRVVAVEVDGTTFKPVAGTRGGGDD